MLHKCANPECVSPFLHLSEGKLFQVETERFPVPSHERTDSGRHPRSLRQVEHYWLCNDCCGLLTLMFEKGRGVVMAPLPQAPVKKTVIPVRLSDLRPSNQPAQAVGQHRNW